MSKSRTALIKDLARELSFEEIESKIYWTESSLLGIKRNKYLNLTEDVEPNQNNFQYLSLLKEVEKYKDRIFKIQLKYPTISYEMAENLLL